MRPKKSLHSFDNEQVDHQHEHDQDHILNPYSDNYSKSQLERYKKVIIALICFIVVIAVLVLYRQFSNAKQIKDGQFYEHQLLGYQLDQFWQMTASQMQQEQADPDHKVIKQGQHTITRKQLGHNAWTLLHMVTGSFPDEINQVLIKKFNAFLILFGQMYPCKLCANHFMTLLKEVGPFNGNTKQGLMTYLCDIHNKVNKRLGKPIHSCQNIVDEWNSCGCSGR